MVLVQGLFTPEQVATVERGIERNLAEPGPMFEVAAHRRIRVASSRTSATGSASPNSRRSRPSRAADVAATLMGCSNVRLYHDHMLVNEPRTQQTTPWHQDQPYYNIDGSDTASMWMPVDPVAAESTLEFLAGSHLGGWRMPRTFMDSEAKWFPEGSLAELPEIEGHREDFEILGWAMEPGDAVFFHMLTLHHAYGVPGARRRRAFSLRFIGDDVRHAAAPVDDVTELRWPRR